MNDRRRRSVSQRLLIWLVVFLLGGVAGYWVRDQQQDREVRRAVQETRREMEEAGLEAIERGRRAGENLGAGARVAAESAMAAFRQLTAPDTIRPSGR